MLQEQTELPSVLGVFNIKLIKAGYKRRILCENIKHIVAVFQSYNFARVPYGKYDLKKTPEWKITANWHGLQ